MKKIIIFLQKVGKLKRLKRAGWVRHSIPDPESVADHSFRTALLAYVLVNELGVNTDKLIKMALLHDLAEALVGDITPHEAAWTHKHETEKKAMHQLTASLKNSEIMDLWLEIEKGVTLEAKALHELDKLEMVLQTLEYEQKYKVDLSEFWDNANQHIQSPKLRLILEILRSKRN